MAASPPSKHATHLFYSDLQIQIQIHRRIQIQRHIQLPQKNHEKTCCHQNMQHICFILFYKIKLVHTQIQRQIQIYRQIQICIQTPHTKNKIKFDAIKTCNTSVFYCYANVNSLSYTKTNTHTNTTKTET